MTNDSSTWRDDLVSGAAHNLLLVLMSVVVGAGIAVLVLPDWLPSLGASLIGVKPKAFWYLSRSSAFIAFGLLWLSMAIGLTMTNKLARVWPGGPTAFDLHQYLSLLGTGFAFFHAAILFGDRYMDATLLQLVVPFANTPYRQLAVGLGQAALYLMAIVGFSFYVRRHLGNRLWRLVHFASFLVFLLALAHGIFSGSDSGDWWAQALYWTSGGSMLFLGIYRLLMASVAREPRRAE